MAHRLPPPEQAGLLLPLALNVALLLMLSSLLLLTLALQSRLQAAVQRQRRLAEDQLMNAAQRWAGRLQRGCPQALAASHGAWGGQPWSGQAGCSGLEAGTGYRVVSYTPGGGPEQGSAELVLELTGTGTGTAPRGAFALHWRRELLAPAEPDESAEAVPDTAAAEIQGEDAQQLAGPPRLVGIEERGLRAAAHTGPEVEP